MNRENLLLFFFVVLGIGVITLSLSANSNLTDPFSKEYVIAQDTLPPIEERYGDFINNQGVNPFDLQDPSIIDQNVEYDPETGLYIITETIGEDYYRMPTYMTFSEYMEWRGQQEERNYFNRLAGISTKKGGDANIIDPVSKIDVEKFLIDRLFGNPTIDIQPQGNIDLTFGVDYYKRDDPGILERQRRQGGFDFDMDINMSVTGQIGDKLSLNTNYNTKATFDFDKQVKLDYNSDLFTEDDIIKKIEAGNVSLPLRGSLIQGNLSLFGLKTELQFGRLRLTAIASQQQSEKKDIEIQGGAQLQEFEVKADEYDENRHFFVSHYNRDVFESSLVELPQVEGLFRIKNIQVWITNDRHETNDVVDIVALTDLGEPSRMTSDNPYLQPPASPVFKDITYTKALPDNNANPLYQMILNTNRIRQIDRAANLLQTAPFNLQSGRDFEKISARRLSQNEFSYHPELGFISVNVNVQPDQVLGIAYEYSYKDTIYQVGEFADDIPPAADTTLPRNLVFVKMLKSSSQRVDVPAWDLMMKNVYSIGAYQVSSEDFRLDIYYEDPGGGDKRFLPESNIAGKPLLRVFNLDKLNTQNDPQPDGVFDFVPGITINPSNGRIMFPVLEPFGDALSAQIDDETYRRKYVYDTLYSTTLTKAREFAHLNKFVIKGTYKSSISNEISLGAFNIPKGSVRVTAGGHLLEEGKDYDIDYGIGRVKILNDAYLSSGQPVRVSFEDQTLFGFQKKTMLGLRTDYEVNKHLNIGGTYLHLFEKPYTGKVNIGDDPINNRIFGLDVSYSNEAPWLTKFVDKIPLINTKAPSNITFMAEAAAIKPGHARAINEAEDKSKQGVVYLDDFEGSVSGIPLYNQLSAWKMASTPHNDAQNNNPYFPEATAINTLLPGVNRAKLSWYRIEPTLKNEVEGNNETGNRFPYTAQIDQKEVFPNWTPTSFIYAPFLTFDLTYYPDRRGPYNFDMPAGTAFSKGVTTDAKGVILKDPKSRWAGIMRPLNTNDFEASNVEYIEFWMLTPFLDPDTLIAGQVVPNPDADNMEGTIYFNLGNISEDILPDSRISFESGLRGTSNLTKNRKIDSTAWGFVPRSSIDLGSFGTNEEDREKLDVGLDGLQDSQEKIRFSNYVNAINAIGGAVESDPANDNFVYYRDDNFSANSSVIDRYYNYNNTQGNSPLQQGNNINNLGYTSIPDSEDMNRDKSFIESESYYQYKIPIKHDGYGGIDKTSNPFITESITSPDGTRIWYRFKIPIDLPDDNPFFERVGGIQDFRSLKYVRMYLKEFEKPITFRFARIELVRNQWRRYSQSLDQNTFGFTPEENSGTAFDVSSVGIVENSQKEPFNYVLPPGVKQEQALGVNSNAYQDERSLTMTVCNLQDGDARAIYKIIDLDMRVFQGLKMFVHGEKGNCTPVDESLEDGDLSVFIRLGSDFTKNYYEYELPLVVSDLDNCPSSSIDDQYQYCVWKVDNNFDFSFETLKNVKLERNASGYSSTQVYPKAGFSDPDNPHGLIRIKGNPNLGKVKSVMIGIRNPKQDAEINPYDDKRPHSAEIWVNELRVVGLDEKGGVAALARMDLQLADFGSVSVSGNYNGIGYGALDQKLAERSREEVIQYDIASSFELGKFFGEKSGVKIPFYTQYSKSLSTPQYDPYDFDIELDDKLRVSQAEQRDSIKNLAQTTTTIKSLNFTNVRKEKTNKDSKPMPWDISNFTVNYSYSQTKRTDPIIQSDILDNYQGGIDYTYTLKGKFIKPFKKLIKNDKYLKFFTDFNFNPLPNSFKFNTMMIRKFNETTYRFVSDDPFYNTFYIKDWRWDRNYNLTWNFAKSLKFNFNASNLGVIDELPEFYEDGTKPTASTKKDYVLDNIRDLGRTKQYNHNFSLNYTLPFKKIPLMDWVKMTASYQAGYSWNASSETVRSVSKGNVIQNNQSRQFQGDLNFEKLYNKSKFLKAINKKGKSKKDKSGRGKKDKKGEKDKLSSKDDSKDNKGKSNTKDKKKKKNKEPSAIAKALIRPLMILRKVKVSYKEGFSTIVPGYMPKTQFFGLSEGFTSPGWEFAAGLQPNIQSDDYYGTNDWLYNNRDWISRDLLLNQQVIQRYDHDFNAKVTLEPFADFKIDIEAKRRYSRNHSEDFRRDTLFDEGTSLYKHLNSQDVGAFTTTYFSMNTLFKNDTEIVDLFHEFEDNRLVISKRLGTGIHKDSLGAVWGYTDGYGRYQQNVILPAFIAAYTGKDPNTIEIDNDYTKVLFGQIPLPNWKLTYNGLTNIPFFKDIFKRFSISHGYKSVLKVNNYNSDLKYDQNNLHKYKETTFDYFSRFEIPDLVIDEKFSPLLEVNMELKEGMSLRLNFDKGRNLQMNFNSYRLNETKTTNFTVGFGHKVKNVYIKFLDFGDKFDISLKNNKKKKNSSKKKGKKGKKGKKKGNDLELKFDFSYRDDVTYVYLLDEDVVEPTRGTRTITASPSAEYKISKQLALRLFMDYRRTIPKTSKQYPNTNIQGGIIVRFSLN